MKKLFSIFVGVAIICLLMVSMGWAQEHHGGGGTGTGVVTDASCQQTKYYPLGILCQDTGTGKLYKGIGSYIEEITAASGTGNVTGVAASTDGELPLFSGVGGKTIKRSNTLTGLVFVQSGVVGVDTSANTRTMLGLGTVATAPSGNFMAASTTPSFTTLTTTGSVTAQGVLDVSGQITGAVDASLNTVHTSTLTVSGDASTNTSHASTYTASGAISGASVTGSGDVSGNTVHGSVLTSSGDVSGNSVHGSTVTASGLVAGSNITALQSLTGTSQGAVNLGTFTGTGAITLDNTNIKNAFQAVETAFESIGGGHTQNTDTGTTSQTFQLQTGSAGVKLKDNAGTLEARNGGDTTYAPFQATTINGTTITGSGDVSGNSMHTSSLTSTGVLDVSGQTTIAADASINTLHTSTVTATGGVTASGLVQGGTLKSTGSTTVNGVLDVSSQTTIAADASINTIHTSTVTASGGMTASGAIQGLTILATGSVTAQGVLDVSGQTTVAADASVNTLHSSTGTFSGGVTATGQVQGGTVLSTGSTTVQGVLDVSGQTTIATDASINTLHSSGLTLSGGATISGDASANSIHTSGTLTAHQVSVDRIAGQTSAVDLYEIPANGNSKVTLKPSDSLAADYTVTFAETGTACTTGSVCTGYQAALTNPVTGTGTNGYLTKWGASGVGDGPKAGTFTDAKWCSYSTAGGLECTQAAPAGTGDVTGGTASAAGELAAYGDTGGKAITRSYFSIAGPSTSAKTKTFSNANDTVAEYAVANAFTANNTFALDVSANTLHTSNFTASGYVIAAGDVSGNSHHSSSSVTSGDTSGNTVHSSTTVTAATDASANTVHSSTTINAGTTVTAATDASANTIHSSTTVTGATDVSGNSMHTYSLTSWGVLDVSGQVTAAADASLNTVHTSSVVASGTLSAVGSITTNNVLDVSGQITGAVDASLNTIHTSSVVASGGISAVGDGSFNTSLKVPLTATTGAGAHNALEDASAQILVRSAVDNKVKALTTYGPRWIDASANITLSQADTQSMALVIDASPTNTVADVSIGLPVILGKTNGCQFQSGIVNILFDGSGNTASATKVIGFYSVDGSQNIMIIDASGYATTGTYYKNVGMVNPSNEMSVAFWGRPITIGGATPGSYCVWAVKMVATNKVTDGSNGLSGW